MIRKVNTSKKVKIKNVPIQTNVKIIPISKLGPPVVPRSLVRHKQ